MMLKQLLAAILLCCSFLAAQTATGSPETVLAGIDIRHTTIPGIQKLYGQQDAMYAVPPDPYPQGTKLYKWGRLTVTLKVLTEPSPQGDVVKAIEVEGEGEPQDKPINKAGRGLKLGAKASDIKKLYGVDSSNGETKIQWLDGTTLIVTLKKERVSKLELRAP
ncbi:MAG: hypothetical protein ACXVZV_09215 [Terriglobales bacterium]